MVEKFMKIRILEVSLLVSLELRLASVLMCVLIRVLIYLVF